MRKKMMKAGLAAAFGLFASYNVYSSQKSVEMSDIALTNVEALAQSIEDPTYGTPFCFNWIAPAYVGEADSFPAFYCGDCQLYMVRDAAGSGMC